MSEEVYAANHIENANEKIMRNFWFKNVIIFSHYVYLQLSHVYCILSMCAKLAYTFDKINGS